jgi:hypothetical protein
VESVGTKEVSGRDDGGLSLNSLPLPPAGHGGAKVVGAQTNVAGVDKAGGGVGDSMNGVGDTVEAGVPEVAEAGVPETMVSGKPWCPARTTWASASLLP